MSIENSAPLFYNYWPQILALVVVYFSAVYFINLKNPDKKSESDNKEKSKQNLKKKYQTPDRGT